ncbi:glycosyltransferase family protein [Leptolyngbya sp. AN02str]|uniref:glycosyltransferase family protein n=1 Tax=Leptolyngbya sp. AN02str TaxID=3423363 RepID=UPI003D31F0C4
MLYSHDTMGLGHKRRNLLIAQTLGSSDLEANILMISGMRDASDVSTPDGVDCLTLPALCKREDGHYQSRRLRLDLEEIIGLRSQLIRTAVKNFQPDVLIVDNVPRGAMRELDPTLEYVQSQPHIRCVLGLRDVLDTPEAVRQDWRRGDYTEALLHYYDAIWIYGDANLYDLRQEYDLSADITTKMKPLGYLNQRPRLQYVRSSVRASLDALNLPNDNLVLCSVGGGQDGAALAQSFAQATFPKAMTGVLLTGPFMPPEVRKTLLAQVAHNPQLHIVDYLEEPTLLLEQASRVIAMGGYNTTCEILSFQKPALLVPRITPRQEQWIRAERLQKRGLVDVLHPDNLSPATLTEWLHQPIPPGQVRSPVNLNGLSNLLIEVRHLLMTTPLSAPHAS